MTLRPLLVYIAGWLLAAAAVAVVVLVLLSGDEDPVALPPVQETELSSAATNAGCVLRAGDDAPASPPLSGPRAVPAAPGVYDAPPPARALVGALRHGTIVILYRPESAQDAVKVLRQLQAAVPRGTIVTPYGEMPFVVAVTAWRRLLGCRAMSDRTLDAVRLFQGRFVGSGPDSPS